MKRVLTKYNGDSTIVFDVIGITDTTGNMGVLGQHCQANGEEHAYCIDHVCHLNAKIAFARKSVVYDYCFSCMMYDIISNIRLCFILDFISRRMGSTVIRWTGGRKNKTHTQSWQDLPKSFLQSQQHQHHQRGYGVGLHKS